MVSSKYTFELYIKDKVKFYCMSIVVSYKVLPYTMRLFILCYQHDCKCKV